MSENTAFVKSRAYFLYTTIFLEAMELSIFYTYDWK